MRIGGVPTRTIWLESDGRSVGIIDQTKLPHRFETVTLRSVADAAAAISTMQVRGAPLIGVTAAYGLALALRDDPSDAALAESAALLLATRPTAVNLAWALNRVSGAVRPFADGCPGRRGLCPGGGDRRGRCRQLPGDRRRRGNAHRGGSRQIRPVAAGRGADPLQRWLARGGRLGHGAGARL